MKLKIYHFFQIMHIIFNQQLIKKFSTSNIAKLKANNESSVPVRLGAMVSNINLRKTKKGKTFASFNLEDLTDGIECVCWDYEQNASALTDDSAVLIEGEFSLEPRVQIVVRSVIPITESVSAHSKQTLIIVREKNIQPDTFAKLEELSKSMASKLCAYEKRLMTTKALSMLHRSQEELKGKFEKYMNDTMNQFSNRKDLEAYIQSNNFASFNQQILLQADQKKQLLSYFRDIRKQHLLYVLFLNDKKEYWLEPSKDNNFLPTWEFIQQVQELLGSRSIKLKSRDFTPVQRRRYQAAKTSWNSSS